MSSTDQAAHLRKKDTWAERLVWRWLRGRRFSGYKFRRQHPVGKYCLDFYCHEALLSIELDGSHHGTPAQQLHDLERTKYLASLGIKELRFWNSRLHRDAETMRATIFRELHQRAPSPLSESKEPIVSDELKR